MSADVLRQAAALMRSRATYFDASTSPWEASPHGDIHDARSLWICDSAGPREAEHVASWHPAVALAVADWLEAEAVAVDFQAQCDSRYRMRANDEALVVARAYLGDDCDAAGVYS